MQVAVAVMLDGTVAVEIAAENALAQWPYLTDMTLIDALIRIFVLPPELTGLQMANTSAGINPDQVRSLVKSVQESTCWGSRGRPTVPAIGKCGAISLFTAQCPNQIYDICNQIWISGRPLRRIVSIIQVHRL